MKKLYKSDSDRVFAGVIGGLGEYFDIDPVILRLGFLIIVIVTGVFPAIIAYIIGALIVPKKPIVHHVHHTEHTPHSESK